MVMAGTPQYQVAFQFQFQQDVSNKAVQIDITDENSFVISDADKLQLAPFDGNATPSLNNMSVSSTTLYLNIASGKAHEGVETILWTTFIGGDAVQVNLQADGSVMAYYSVLGAPGGSGPLKPGPNSIELGSGD
jgi:hypothetical protein